MNAKVIHYAGFLQSIETEWNGIRRGWRWLPIKQGALEGLQAHVASAGGMT
jgi:hypothetical protein